jgi:hypothetical protein
MLSRRSVLQVLSAGALAGCAPGVDPAAAWRAPGAGEADPRRFALAHAILAPNPHNRQPWLVALRGEDEIDLWVDRERRLPATDPPDRQITLGCGAFIELLDLAAREVGRRAEISLWPEGEPQPRLDARPVVHIRLTRGEPPARDPLFAQITRRHTHRKPYDLRRPPTQAEVGAVIAAATGPDMEAGVVDEAAKVRRLVDLAWRGWEVETNTPATNMETVRLMRIGAAEIARHRDGVALDGPAIEAMSRLGLVTPATLADPNSSASRQGADMWRKMIEATPAFFWLKSGGNSRVHQIAAGRAYARAHLAATAQGLSMHPWSMTLQEFPEMADLYRLTQAEFGASPDAPVQMLARLGRADGARPAPRRGLEAHLVS